MFTPKIRVLDPKIAEKIAAGEVVERPMSVVKEIVENALDAKATDVCVRLEQGGKALIEVIDNGHGIHRDDLKTALLRHATSKISNLEDLDRIHTLGFRGEALAAISAVSKLKMTSRLQGEGTSYEIDNQLLDKSGRELFLSDSFRPDQSSVQSFSGSAHGTRLQIRELFSEVPARLKFLKSDGAEASQVREWLERLALSRPDVRFRFEHNEKKVFDYKAESLLKRMENILGDGSKVNIIEKAFSHPELNLTIHWIQGQSVANGRKLIQIVNGRILRDKLIQAAIMSGFKQALLPGQYPAIVVEMRVDPSTLDVNVHPTKTEVRFLDTQLIFKALDQNIREMVRSSGFFANIQESLESKSRDFSGELGARPTMAYEWKSDQSSPNALPDLRVGSECVNDSYLGGATGASAGDSADSVERSKMAATFFGVQGVSERPVGKQVSFDTLTPAIHPLENARFRGVLFSTYLMYEGSDEVFFLDQHAAHERVKFEKLKREVLEHRVVSQDLLVPEVIARPDFPESKRQILCDLGFDVEDFGDGRLLFRSIPALWGMVSVRDRLANLVERVAETSLEGLAEMDERMFEKLASEACRSSVRAGDSMSEVGAQTLVNQLFGCEHPWNCPHGRPTLVRVSRGKMEEWFQRIVTRN